MSIALLATQIRNRLGPVPVRRNWPLVSIIVLNRDGAGMLRRLLTGLVMHTEYRDVELILVDNGSSDESLDFIRSVEVPFPISIVANPHNESFSDGSNRGAQLASGELLLFLNNDVEPFEPGWLRELVVCRESSRAAAVAATLLCSDREHRVSFSHGYGVQHRGLAFRDEGRMVHPVLHGWEADPLDERLGVDDERAAAAAACLMVERGAFELVGGFSRGYVYGAEDVDLCLKLRAAGLGVFCSGRSIAIHHPVSTRRAAPFEEERARKLANRRVLWERWGPRLRREYELDLLDGRGLWAQPDMGAAYRPRSPSCRAEIEAPGFCFKCAEPSANLELDAVAAALRRRGHRCLRLNGGRVEDDEGLNYDVAVHVWGSIRYLPKPGQLNVLLVIDGGEGVTEVDRSHYDLVLEGGQGDPGRLADRLAAGTGVDSAQRVGLRIDPGGGY